MKTLIAVVLSFVAATETHAQSAFEALGNMNIAAVSVSKGQGPQRSVSVRTRKLNGIAHGHPARVWMECKLSGDRTYLLGMTRSASIRHYQAYEALGARAEFPADFLAADADQRGLANMATMTFYQGQFAKLGWGSYEAHFLLAAKNLKSTETLPLSRVELVLNSADQSANRRNALSAIQYLGGIAGLKQLMIACGTPRGLRDDVLEFNVR